MEEPQNTTALQKGGSKDIKTWLSGDKFKEALKASLPSHMTPERFVRVSLTAMMKTPKLAECSQESIFKVMLDLSSLGLEPDGRRAHLIPYNNNKTGKMEAQLIIDYKGLIELAKRSGEVQSIRAELVCEKDVFSWENGIVAHKIDFLKPRGKTLAVYSHVKNKNGVDEYEVMTLEQVEGIRKRSKAGNSGPWVTDFDEMAKKSVIRRHSKKLTLSPEFNEALLKDSDQLSEIEVPEFSFDDLMPKRMSEAKPTPTEISIPKDDSIFEPALSAKEMESVWNSIRENEIGKSEFTAYLNSIGVKDGIIHKKDLTGVEKWINAMKPAR